MHTPSSRSVARTWPGSLGRSRHSRRCTARGGGDEAALTDVLTAPDDPFDGGLDLYGVDEETVTL